ncbi:MAG: hypothetical protein ACRELB_07525 [Polyangiaceae bacterium]
MPPEKDPIVYLFVDEDIVWQVVLRDLPDLIERLRALLEMR